MHDARDAEDARLIAAGDYARLLATWLPTVQTRVYARVPGSAADDVVQEIMLRLCRELAAGKRYSVPFRVVVHNVTTWLVKAAHQQGDGVTLVPLDEEWEAGIESEPQDPDELERLLALLPPRDREAFVLRCLLDLSAKAAAARLGIEPNAVDQAYHRARIRLRELLEDG